MMHLAATLTLLGSTLAAGLPDDYSLPPAPGPFVGKAEVGQTFASGRPIVATTYFYWYDAATNEHIINGDGTDALTDHPPTLEGLQLPQRRLARPATRGHDRRGHRRRPAGLLGRALGEARCFGFSDAGLPKLVAARERLLAAGQDAAADRHVLRHQHLAAQQQALPCRSDHPDRPALVLRHDPQFLLADPAAASGDDRRQADRLPLRPRRSPRTSTPRCFPPRGRCFARISGPTCIW